MFVGIIRIYKMLLTLNIYLKTKVKAVQTLKVSWKNNLKNYQKMALFKHKQLVLKSLGTNF